MVSRSMNLLTLDALDVFHGDLQATFGVSLAVDAGETIAIIGANGAGKSTILRSIIGLTPPRNGRIRFDGSVALVPEGRRLFSSLSVEENLLVAAAKGRPGAWTLDAVYELFPAMREFRNSLAAEISGGQQQMVAIGRALLCNPKLLLCDEISLGLAPKIVGEIYSCFSRIRESGTAVVLVEQDIARARQSSDRLYCLLKGRVTLEGRSSTASLDDIRHAYFGDRRS